MTDDPSPAEMLRSDAPRPIWARLSLIWLVPVAALAITLFIAWRNWADRGELIEIAFEDATGVVAGETALKFRDVQVGRVERVAFNGDLSEVLLGVRVDKDIAPFLDTEAEFWLVRPEVSARGIENLGTVLSGTYIEGYWDAKPGETVERFEGLPTPPLDATRRAGTWVTLATEDAGGLAPGAPVLYRGVTVGHLANIRVDETGESVLVDAFVEAPISDKLTTATRFWDTSGLSVSLGAAGVAVDVRSLASLVQGGIEFSTYETGGTAVAPGTRFRLYETRDDARNSLFDNSAASAVRYTLLFDDATAGLELGGKVQFRGVEAGEVTDISVRIDEDAEGRRRVRQQVVISLSPKRLGLPDGIGEAAVTEFLAGQVADGLRARIAGTGLLGQTMVVEMTDLPGGTIAALDPGAQPFPAIPTAPPVNTDLAANAEGLFDRVSNLPIEKVLESAIGMMDSVTAIASSQETRKIPGEIAAFAAEMRALATDLNAGEAGAKAVAAVEQVDAAATATAEAFAGLPETLEEVRKFSARAAQMPLEEIGTEVEGIVKDLRAMLGSKDAEALPRALSDTLTEAAALLSELREGGAAQNLNGALASAQSAADSIATGTQRLPETTRRLEALIARADTLVASYGERSTFNATLTEALREIERAAQNFGALARTIDRNPRAFILGR